MSQVHYALEGATVAALQPYRDDLPQDGDPGEAPAAVGILLAHARSAALPASALLSYPWRLRRPLAWSCADMDTIEAYVDPSKLTGAYDTRPCHVLGCFTEVRACCLGNSPVSLIAAGVSIGQQAIVLLCRQMSATSRAADSHGRAPSLKTCTSLPSTRAATCPWS